MVNDPSNPAAADDATAGPLSGVRIIDLSAYIAGPYGCTLLADQGADVIKVEPPGGDNLREYPSTLPSESRAVLGVNRSKRGVVLDLKRPEDHAVLLRLVRDADVLVHNFRPSVPPRLGIDYDRHALMAGLTRKLTERVTANLRYGFYRYAEPSMGGVNDYTAHGIFAMVAVKWP